ncbi:MAG: hypothetical protein J1F18_02175 [Lachnospiraceae bacterium]|nr:hypothetical protein [Lachnospiraceae bacterium]
MNKTKWIPFLRLIVGALIIELTVCNFSAWQSFIYRDRTVFENVRVEGGTANPESLNQYTVPDGVMTLYIDDVNMTVHNLFFALDFSENTPVSYTVSLTDEGNYYPYNLPEQMLVPGIPKSFYTNIYPSGKVKSVSVQLTVPPESTVTVSGIGANARIPFVISPVRFLLILGVFLFIYYLLHTDKWQAAVCDGTIRQRMITTAVILCLVGLAWSLAHVNPICIASPWPHHKQYQELAEVMAEGHFYLNAEPSEGLLNAENPYDTIYLQANGIDYLADYAYYEGKYYVYFGVVPELLLYLPVYLISGHHLPNYAAVFLFYCGFILAVFGLYREIIKRWFARTPYFLYLILCILTVCCGNYLFVIARPDLYDTPIMAANMFTVAGLRLWIKGKNTESVKGRRVTLFLGSLCMALVAGCRPQMLVFSFLAIPLFLEEFIPRQHSVGSGRGDATAQSPINRQTLSDAVSFCLPYLFVAAGIMYYNAARFGSPFDFGATYSLTSNDMTKRSFNLHQAILGLWHYIFRPPVIESDFPFLQGIQIGSASYMGKLNAEYTYGGLLACNAFLWVLLSVLRSQKILREKGIYALTILSASFTAILCIVDVTGAGILQRYMVDMIWGIWFAAVLLMLAWIERAADKGTLKTAALFLIVICLLQAAYGFGVVFGNGDLSVNVRTSNPTLYYYLKELVSF